MFFNNVLKGAKSGLIRAVRAERMPVFVSDDKKVFCFDVKIPMKPLLNQFVQKFGIARGISRLTNLTMVYITTAAAGFIASLSLLGRFSATVIPPRTAAKSPVTTAKSTSTIVCFSSPPAETFCS